MTHHPHIDLYVQMCGLSLTQGHREQITRLAAGYPSQARGLEDKVAFLLRKAKHLTPSEPSPADSSAEKNALNQVDHQTAFHPFQARTNGST